MAEWINLKEYGYPIECQKNVIDYSYIITTAKESDKRVRENRKVEELAYIDEIIQTCIKYQKTTFVLVNPSKDAIEVLRNKGYQIEEIKAPNFTPWDNFYTVSFG